MKFKFSHTNQTELEINGKKMTTLHGQNLYLPRSTQERNERIKDTIRACYSVEGLCLHTTESTIEGLTKRLEEMLWQIGYTDRQAWFLAQKLLTYRDHSACMYLLRHVLEYQETD